MKIKVLALVAMVITAFYGCQNDPLETLEEATPIIALDLKTFIPSQDLDNTPKGKYVGVIGHHTNANIHGKIFINSGQHNQYNALVQMTNGNILKFIGTPQTRDALVVYFEGESGSFTVNFEEFQEPVLSSVQFNNETSDGYLVVQKSTRGVDAFVLLGTYEDSTNLAFNGNWDLMGDGTVADVPVMVMVPGVPVPVELLIPTENISTLTVTHTGSAAPFMDTSFETNTAQGCIQAALPGAMFSSDPFFIPSDIPNPLGGFLGGAGSVSSGGQTSTLNGSDATWSLSYGAPIPLAGIDGGFTTDDCIVATSGTWSWNGRSGTISIDGI